MDPRALEPKHRVAYAVGTYVLLSQEVERLFKYVVPFIDRGDPSISSILTRHSQIAKDTLGSVSGKFMKAAKGDIASMQELLGQVIRERNEIVHQFSDAFADLLAVEAYDGVLERIRQRHRRMRDVLVMLRQLALAISELMRDGPFKGAEEFEDMAGLCDALRNNWMMTPSCHAPK